MKKEEIKYVNYQLIVIALTILAGCVSFFITYNQKRALEKKKTLINKKTLLTVSLMNRILFLITGSLFLLINLKLYEISKSNCKNTYLIETKDDLDLEKIKEFKEIGIMAGASTPDGIIKEVYSLIEKVNNL